MNLTDQKDKVCWEKLEAFNIVKRESLSDRNELGEDQRTIIGEHKEWQIAATSDEKGSLAELALIRCGVERYTFTNNLENQAITAEANNSSQMLGSMLHIAATLMVNPKADWA